MFPPQPGSHTADAGGVEGAAALGIAPMRWQIKRLLMVIRTSGCNETTRVDLSGGGVEEHLPPPSVIKEY